MRILNQFVERYRIKTGKPASDATFGNNGQFLVPRNSVILRVLVSDQAGWDHISVSLPDRCPTWDELQYVRDLWFATTEWVVQYSPPRAAHINCHPFCLHLWRKQTVTETPWLPTPPDWMIGPKPGESRAQAECRAREEYHRAEI